MRVVFTGGGSGGHVFSNVAILHELLSKGVCVTSDLAYVGTKSGFERSVIQEMSIMYRGIDSGKYRRYFSWKNAFDLVHVLIGFFQSVWFMRRWRPDVLFSKGGYVSLPVVVAGWMLRVPVVIHESDVYPGLANRIAARFATVICLSTRETERYFLGKKTMLTGIPLRSDLRNGSSDRARQMTGLVEHLPVVLFMGGGNGDAVINALLEKFLPKLLTAFQVIHLSGSSTQPKVVHRYARFPFLSSEMADVYALADLVVSRAGATTLAEIAELHKPYILFPMPKGCSRGEQVLNARIFANDHGYGAAYEEKDCGSLDLFQCISDFLAKNHDARTPLSDASGNSSASIVAKLLVNTAQSARFSRLGIVDVFQWVFAFVLAIFCLPLCMVIAALIAAIDGFPVLFVQERIGKNRSPFFYGSFVR
jgi:UDP-N-acetylglucosamine--N-acetylmuramyl-(pentapeptide) pyrophosphoryl-undecaprenol N-acetylglucosamine transferase